MSAILTRSSRKWGSSKSITLGWLKAWDQTFSRASKLLRILAWRDKTPLSSSQENPTMHTQAGGEEHPPNWHHSWLFLPQKGNTLAIQRSLSSHCSNWPSTHSDWSSGWRSGMRRSVLWETSRTGLQIGINRYFQEEILRAQILHLLISRKDKVVHSEKDKVVHSDICCSWVAASLCQDACSTACTPFH